MKKLRWSIILAAVISMAVAQQASAQSILGIVAQLLHVKQPVLLGTTGSCLNAFQGGPCTQTSTLVLLDPDTGALIKTIGPVGFTVNGLAWDRTTGKLFATTALGDLKFHGLITINPFTGAGKPVNKNVVNFGLTGDPAPVHSISVDVFGHMVGWYDEKIPPASSDTYVRINQNTGVATEFLNTGINTSQNGVSFGEFNLLWNFDSPTVEIDPITQVVTPVQNAYLLNPFDGKPLLTKRLSPQVAVALGDFNPVNNLYYGLNFNPASNPPFETSIWVVDVVSGTVTPLGATVDGLHTLAFIP